MQGRAAEVGQALSAEDGVAHAVRCVEYIHAQHPF